MPGRGELDGVADQVEQDLAQPARIEPDDRRCARQQLAAELELALAGARLELQAQPLEERGDVDLDRRQLELAGVDPAEVEDVVDEGEQGLGGLERAVEVGALLGVQRRVAQQPGHADHAVHGLADLVAHHGEEAGPGEARLLGAPAAAAQPLESSAPGPTASDVAPGFRSTAAVRRAFVMAITKLPTAEPAGRMPNARRSRHAGYSTYN